MGILKYNMVKKTTKRTVRKNAPVTRGIFLRPFSLAHAVGTLFAVAIFFFAFMSWFSNFDGTSIIDRYPLPFSFEDWTFLMGLIQSYVFGYVSGWIVAKVYNKY
jgi:hypothetical protein